MKCAFHTVARDGIQKGAPRPMSSRTHRAKTGLSLTGYLRCRKGSLPCPPIEGHCTNRYSMTASSRESTLSRISSDTCQQSMTSKLSRVMSSHSCLRSSSPESASGTHNLGRLALKCFLEGPDLGPLLSAHRSRSTWYRLSCSCEVPDATGPQVLPRSNVRHQGHTASRGQTKRSVVP